MSRPTRGTGLASSHARFQRRAQDVRRRPWRLAAYAAVVLAVVALLVWAVGFSPLFAVRSVEVVGVPPAQVPAIRSLAEVPQGQPLARVDRKAVAGRVAQLATLADVSIELSWPSTLVIHASPRVPFLVVKNPQGQLQVVDASGLAYAHVDAAPKGVPVVNAASQAALSRDALAAAVSVVRVLPDHLQRQVTRVVVSSADLVTLTLGRTQVVWGGIDQPERKLTIMTALLTGAPRVIDVSAPDTPVTR
ncbi:cell division protein FtsQ/DivIB [Nostocoides sp. HKS02]|uniref:cell division protein FtsQ/DivIB n=1 Tax=Nostocoides sp. HKS02 TaxID=1813880 RepID=UPI0012B4DB1B|nr:FtsQ-type POTRA domain-containing protein [Tetrasphaera sp. HKS02]QGN57625.1 FtsQ-type POTRA domain-containing protein [Tetrasphaera sp. HKS02]